LQSAQDKVMAFDLGAMDYISKPFDLTELRVRIRSALRLDRLLRMLSERAHVDGLTGLLNRAHFDQRWPDVVEVAHRRSQPLALAMIDVDHFKSINDSFGHPAGDAVLQGISQEFQSLCRDTDVPCRYGGEELALIMVGTPIDKAQIVCERIREQIAALAWARHPERAVTVSIGIAGTTGPAPEISPDAWLDAADKALYTSKQQGRNRITVKELDRPALAEAS
jgi:diguanylate cyclase (GGDEF)-like protein